MGLSSFIVEHPCLRQGVQSFQPNDQLVSAPVDHPIRVPPFSRLCLQMSKPPIGAIIWTPAHMLDDPSPGAV